jgi:hypothetical protein
VNFHYWAITASAPYFLPCVFLIFIPNLHLHRDNQPSVSLHLSWPSFLAKSSDLLLKFGRIRTTNLLVMIEKYRLRAWWTSGTLTSLFRFWEFLCCRWRNVLSSRSFTCFFMTRVITDIGSPLIYASYRWLVSSSLLLICQRMQISLIVLISPRLFYISK